MSKLVIRIALIGIIAVTVGAFRLVTGLQSANDIKVGDCFDSSEAVKISDVTHRACTEPHQYEAFATLTYPAASAAAYPSIDDFRTFFASDGPAAFQSYVGVSADTSGLEVGFFYPNKEGWDGGNHVVIGYLYQPPDGSKSTASLKGSAK